MNYCDYSFYEEKYGGKMSESNWNRLSIEASMYIKRNTSGKIDNIFVKVPDEVKYCVCTIADKLQNIEQRTGKSSESVGSWSVSYQNSGDSDKELYDTLMNYLFDIKTDDGNSILCRRC